MTINNSAKASSRRGKRSSKPTSPEAENQTVEAKAMNAENKVKQDPADATKEETMATDNVVKIPARSAQSDDAQPIEGSIQLHQSSFPDAPAISSEIEIAGTYSEAGVRPIGTSSIELFDSYLNGRPISASHLEIFEMLPGGRPVFVSDIKMVDGAIFADHRPILASDPKLMEGSYLPGNRPIASNEIDDSTSLMGFID